MHTGFFISKTQTYQTALIPQKGKDEENKLSFSNFTYLNFEIESSVVSYLL